jgi:hypothetical protein
MSKIKILTHIKNPEGVIEKKVDAILQDNVLKYKEDDATTTVFSYEKKTLVRDNNELRMEYDFNEEKTHGEIKIKDLNKKIIVEIETTKMKIDNYNIEIDFKIEENKFTYKVEVIK